MGTLAAACKWRVDSSVGRAGGHDPGAAETWRQNVWCSAAYPHCRLRLLVVVDYCQYLCCILFVWTAIYGDTVGHGDGARVRDVGWQPLSIRDQCHHRYLSNLVDCGIISGGGGVHLVTLLATMCWLSLRGERKQCYPQTFIPFVFVRFLAPLLLRSFVSSLFIVHCSLSIVHCSSVVGVDVVRIEIWNDLFGICDVAMTNRNCYFKIENFRNVKMNFEMIPAIFWGQFGFLVWSVRGQGNIPWFVRCNVLVAGAR